MAPIFRRQAETAVSNGELSPEQQEVLDELDGAIADQQLSPEEYEELRLLARNLRVSATMDSATQRTLGRYRLFWQIENSDAPEIDAGINLIRGERGFYRCDAAWHELKQVTRRFNYGGPTVRIKIMKGVYWQAGSLGVQIEKDAGASPSLETSADMELFGLLIGRAIRDQMPT